MLPTTCPSCPRPRPRPGPRPWVQLLGSVLTHFLPSRPLLPSPPIPAPLDALRVANPDLSCRRPFALSALRFSAVARAQRHQPGQELLRTHILRGGPAPGFRQALQCVNTPTHSVFSRLTPVCPRVSMPLTSGYLPHLLFSVWNLSTGARLLLFPPPSESQSTSPVGSLTFPDHIKPGPRAFALASSSAVLPTSYPQGCSPHLL